MNKLSQFIQANYLNIKQLISNYDSKLNVKRKQVIINKKIKATGFFNQILIDSQQKEILKLWILPMSMK